MTRRAGYSLVEMLVALTAIGFALGGLSLGTRTIALASKAAQDNVARGSSFRKLQTDFEQHLGRARLAEVVAQSDALQFECGEGTLCEIRIEPNGADGSVVRLLPAGRAHQVPERDLRLVYVTSQGVATGSPFPPAARLQSVALVSGRDSVLASGRYQPSDPLTCDFDLIGQACRVGVE